MKRRETATAEPQDRHAGNNITGTEIREDAAMTKAYRGYELRTYETMGIGMGTYYEVWKDGEMQGFASNLEDAEIMIDRMIKKA